MMKFLAIGFALLTLTPLALADRDDRRPKTSGAIAWSTRYRDGNSFAIVFQFGDRNAVSVRYEEDRYRRDHRYRRDDRYYAPPCPPLYDYSRYKKGRYDTRHFGSYDEWNDWKQWQKHWSKRKHWNHDSRERARAWAAFCYERELAQDHYYRSRDRRYDRRGDRDDDDDDDRRRRRGRG